MGRVKTRLARDSGAPAAAGFYRLAVRRLLGRLQAPREWTTRLAVNAGPQDRYHAWPPGTQRVAQGTGSLGDRMAFVLRRLPPGPVVIIGSDSPQIEPPLIREAFGRLGAHEAVFASSPDGGFSLIGLARRRPAPHLFSGVRWSTEHALADTRASLPASFSVDLMPSLLDVDEGEDLRALMAAFGALRFGPWAPPTRRPGRAEHGS